MDLVRPGAVGPALVSPTVVSPASVAPVETDPLAALSDEFPGSSLDESWTEYEGDGTYAVNTVSGGQYSMEPDAGGTAGSFWFNGEQGLLTYKEVAGDFQCECRVHVTNSAGDDAPPVTQFRIAGIAAHDPDRDSVRNYVHIGLGSTAEADNRVEHKTTVDDVSTFGSASFTNGTNELDGYLRLTRVSDTFTCYYSSDGESWTELESWERADLPSTLQVGMVVYSNQTVHDIAASFDYVRFSTP